MAVCGQDDIDAGDARGELAIDVETVVGQEHDQTGAVPARLLDIRTQVILANAERPARDHPARVGDRRVGKGLPDHRNARAGTFDHGHRLEHRLVPFGVANVLSDERKSELAGDLHHAVATEGELPVSDHGVGSQQRHAFDHVLALAEQRRIAVLPCVAAVEQHHPVAALGTNRLDDRGNAVEPAHAAVAPGQGGEVHSGERIGCSRAGRDPIEVEQRLAADMRNQSFHLADAEIDRRLAEQQRHELGVEIGNVNEGNVADRLEVQQLLLGEALLSEGTRRDLRQERCRRRGHLQKIPPREHAELRPVRDASVGARQTVDRRRRVSRRYVTVIDSSPTILLPSSSTQVSTTAPDSCARNLNWMYGLAEIAGSRSAEKTSLPFTVQMNLFRILRGIRLPAPSLRWPELHDVRYQGLDLDEVALLRLLLVQLDARLHFGHGNFSLRRERAGRSQPPQPPIVTFTALLVVKNDPSLILATAMIFWDSASRIRTLASATPLSGEK